MAAENLELIQNIFLSTRETFISLMSEGINGTLKSIMEICTFRFYFDDFVFPEYLYLTFSTISLFQQLASQVRFWPTLFEVQKVHTDTREKRGVYRANKVIDLDVNFQKVGRFVIGMFLLTTRVQWRVIQI